MKMTTIMLIIINKMRSIIANIDNKKIVLLTIKKIEILLLCYV